MMNRFLIFVALAAGAAALAPATALAEKFKAGPGDPAWMHLGADALLWAHIGGGAIGLVAGVFALAARPAPHSHPSVRDASTPH